MGRSAMAWSISIREPLAMSRRAVSSHSSGAWGLTGIPQSGLHVDPHVKQQPPLLTKKFPRRAIGRKNRKANLSFLELPTLNTGSLEKNSWAEFP